LKAVYCLSIGEVVRGSTWLYIGALFFSFLGFFFWLIASLFVSPDVIGTAAAIISLESLFITTFSLGMNVGIRRFIGSTWAAQELDKLSSYFTTSILFTIITNIPVILILFTISSASIGAFGVGPLELYYVAILLILGILAPLLYSILNSVLNTKETAIADIALSIMKLIVGIALLYLGYGFVGIFIAFIVGSAVRGVLLATFTARLFKRYNIQVKVQFDTTLLREVFHSGIATWIPTVLTTVGQSFAILIIFGVVGGGETGSFFIVFAISLIVYRISDSIMMLMFPVLSGMSSGRKTTISKAIRLSLTATILISFILVLYPSLLLGLFGPAYQQSSLILVILCLGAIVYPIVSGYNCFIYAEGKYTHVTIIGIVMTSARLVLYVMLVSNYGDLGIAIAYDLGLVLALLPVVLSARSVDFKFPWVQYLEILATPSVIAVIFYFILIPWFIGIPVILLLSVASYTRMGIITRSDVSEIAGAFFSREVIRKLRDRTEPVLAILFKE
jgi:O-antigen/teichoic acid export membrane protein